MTVSAHFGLTSSQFQAIQQVLANTLNLEQAIIYGSRALGREKPGSDIDLMLVGEHFSHTDLLHLMNELDDLLTPYSFDLCRQQDISHPDLLEHIARVGQLFYQRGLACHSKN
ncbi:nucleotidyltransferase domain-containing protein [Rheinheimera sp.]|uniref:nucleotidyltransferase domain-containing protein n=1 Tax=Rheinheimera sp. TaxID=1869214 RepID=UPI00307EDCAB